MVSKTPYLVRAIYTWCVDNSLTAMVVVRVNANTRVPVAHVQNGLITLNIGPNAAKDVVIDNDALTCSLRFTGIRHNIYVPIEAITAIFERESGDGLSFATETHAVHQPKSLTASDTKPNKRSKPVLRIVE